MTRDYVVTEVIETSHATKVEHVTGRMIEVSAGDFVIGALGVRAATLEAVGSWRAVTDDQQIQALTAAGIIGRVTSRSTFIPKPMGLACASAFAPTGLLTSRTDLKFEGLPFTIRQ